MSVFSTSTGVPYPAKNAAELFECVISELLTRAICWDQIISDVIDRVKCTAASEVVLSCFGNSIPLNDLNTALKNNMSHLEVSINNFMP